MTAPGEVVCGDGYRVIARETDVLVAVVDGLGHGPSAKEAADAFLDFVDRYPHLPLPDLIARGGRAIAATRGVAATLARLGPDWIELLGVGNVRVIARARSPFLAVPAPGIVGSIHRQPQVAVGAVVPGDLFLICTDGVSHPGRLEGDDLHLPVSELARNILAGSKTRQDDATVVVARAGD
jgi:negative regulator of sigma-B (phosphoserine phosphatase)